MINALMKEFPHLDYMMAECLVKSYEKGNLEELIDSKTVDSPIKNVQVVLPDAITVSEKEIEVK